MWEKAEAERVRRTIAASGTPVHEAAVQYNTRAVAVISYFPMLAAPPLDRSVEAERRELRRLVHLLGKCIPQRVAHDMVAHVAPRMRGVESAVPAVSVWSAQHVLAEAPAQLCALEVAVETFGVLADLAQLGHRAHVGDSGPKFGGGRAHRAQDRGCRWAADAD